MKVLKHNREFRGRSELTLPFRLSSPWPCTSSRPHPLRPKHSIEAAEPQGVSTASEEVIAELSQAISLLQLGKSNEAEQILRRVISATPQNSDAHNLLE